MSKSSEDTSFWDPKCPNFPQWDFFQKKHYNNFDTILGPFYYGKFKKKIIKADPEL